MMATIDIRDCLLHCRASPQSTGDLPHNNCRNYSCD